MWLIAARAHPRPRAARPPSEPALRPRAADARVPASRRMTRPDDAQLFRRDGGEPDPYGRPTSRIPRTPSSIPAPRASTARRSSSSASRTCGASPSSTSPAAADGVTDWRFDPEPLLRADVDRDPEETWGCEDPRLTWLPEREEWAIAYTAYSRRGPLVSLATTRDFRSVRRLGPVMPPEDKDAALFPRRFDGRWAMIHRPSPLRGGAHMWISYSPDLRHWGDHKLLLEARDGAWWDAGKIGLGPPPLETPEGWLVMYHGVRTTSRRPDLPGRPRAARPRRSAAACSIGPTSGSSGPTAPYEITGDVGRVVFPCGWVLDPAGDGRQRVLRGGRLGGRRRDGAARRSPGERSQRAGTVAARHVGATGYPLTAPGDGRAVKEWQRGNELASLPASVGTGAGR